MIWYHTTSNHIRRHQTAMSTYYYDKCQHMPYHLSVSFLYQCSFIYFDHILPLLYFTLLYFTLLYFTLLYFPVPFPLFSFSLSIHFTFFLSIFEYSFLLLLIFFIQFYFQWKCLLLSINTSLSPSLFFAQNISFVFILSSTYLFRFLISPLIKYNEQ